MKPLHPLSQNYLPPYNQILFLPQSPAHPPHSLNLLHSLVKALSEPFSPALSLQPLPPNSRPLVVALHMQVTLDLVDMDEFLQLFKPRADINL